ncbi:MAG: hypothetical protein ACW98X_21515 [Promethearchaeota archaeon]
MKCPWCESKDNKSMYYIVLANKSEAEYICKNCLDRMREIRDQLKRVWG